ncbi:5'-methylthioadenosine/S-adenosylhomocysteine nucleosidase [Mesorhizobium sp. M4B.F.Ca.ET.190.01.1.1]|uniref:5'-methylthioadenosine/S-adenosylhomocysteine nucleosidase n=1 Tax=unclassified Mesorhizobium TaxID=325217 RepID=UPI000FE77E5E|nr:MULTISPECIES: 5'-methylthioadenosine/S-adenosylhomocysteine nucleosidase [unclassified Mesorhizobium]RWF61525.1 MAG: 5'-methylthioadenosine/S-adenosylhomocysteine nucleosidase [Mesorhizobium sp.]TGQ27874.1 5'-methylthioadenosine/S-adenosylhomocysteine nucleosidase [Mesorhizobium sp. M4B.F.Ca.ET.214.01.1.1]TGQ54953.1 5'-methylthioadenosine/S-adenosylhomocysteine nucleosidase [Mesorhizobium sp. M4B.F.Ca.ET.211.01.1.1]TGQ99416.1 5'-methylthioadenosine/S-adenosylhomocysteine nucleosidase [Mesorh
MTVKVSRLSGSDVLFVMAVEAEYGPHLRKLFTPLMTGVGPVEAGIRLGAELARLKLENALPDLVVSLGSAGSRRLEQAEIYQAVSVAYRDIDASPLGFVKGATPFLDLPVTVPLPIRIPGIREASLSTGGAVISGVAYDAIAADMVDMETFACLRACQLFGVPLIGLRGISDGAADLRHVGDWTEYLHVIDEKLAGAIGLLEQAIASGTIRLGSRQGLD